MQLVDALLQTLNRPNLEIDRDRDRAALAQHRLQEIRDGSVETVPGEVVLQRIRQRFGK